jgi:hypothetical protein
MLPDFSPDSTGVPVADTRSTLTPTPVDGSSAPERIESLIDTASNYRHPESSAETEHRCEKGRCLGVQQMRKVDLELKSKQATVTFACTCLRGLE